MRGHKVVTVERNGGYAARCEVERDGVNYLCDATFGGFATRTEAREAIVHEETAGAVDAAAGGLTPKEGNQMSTPNDITLADAVPAAMGAVIDSPSGIVYIDPTGPLGRIEGRHVVPKAELPGLTADDVRERVWTAAYDRSGARRHYLDRGFWKTAMEVATRVQHSVLAGHASNAAVMIDDLLVVGWGRRVLVDETETEFVFLSGEAAEVYLDQQFLLQHTAQIAFARPEWMLPGEKPSVLRGHGGGSVMFARGIGAVQLSSAIEICDGEWTVEETVVILPASEQVGRSDLPGLVANLTEAYGAAGWGADVERTEEGQR